MNTTDLLENWQIQKARIKQKFIILTDKDLLFIDGKKDEMIIRLQLKLGKTKNEIYKILEEI